MYTQKQKSIIVHARAKVKNLFVVHPVKAHGFDHAFRVANWAVQIAKGENANIFLCEMAGLLHDIGRMQEKGGPAMTGATHHELSYEMLRKWFLEDRFFDILTRKEKIILLYSARYHWNNVADKYDVAWILRDADKVGGFGKIGLRRIEQAYQDNVESTDLALRLLFDSYFWLKTKTARKIVEDKKMMEPTVGLYKKLLQARIEPVELK